MSEGLGFAELKEEGARILYDGVEPGPPPARSWWWRLRVGVGFSLVRLAEFISPIRPYENSDSGW